MHVNVSLLVAVLAVFHGTMAAPAVRLVDVRTEIGEEDI